MEAGAGAGAGDLKFKVRMVYIVSSKPCLEKQTKTLLTEGMVVHPFNPSTPEAEARGSLERRARAVWRTARITQEDRASKLQYKTLWETLPIYMSPFLTSSLTIQQESEFSQETASSAMTASYCPEMVNADLLTCLD